jgi:glycosyltransferase involved in cell wall biosynthesis
VDEAIININTTMKLPKISIALPVWNEEKSIKETLQSVFNQNYPKDLMEIFVIDDDSIDGTVSIASKYPVTIIKNGTHDAEKGKLIALKRSTGEYFTYIEGDLTFKRNDFLRLMVKPLEIDPKVGMSFTSYYSKNTEPPINRFLSVDPIQRDPLHRFFTPSVEKCITKKLNGYYLCTFEKGKIVPHGIGLYRKSILDVIYKDSKAYTDRFLELDNEVSFVEMGHTLWAYVPQAGYYHSHVASLMDLLIKRKRNLVKVFLPQEEIRKFRWIDTDSRKGKLRIVLWIFYSLSFIFPFFTGVYRSIRYKTWVCLYEPLVAFGETAIIIWTLFSESKGRALILKLFR